MTAVIDNNVLNFVKESAKFFKENPTWERYINEQGKYIALLWNKDIGSMKVYKLGDEIGIFNDFIETAYLHLFNTTDFVGGRLEYSPEQWETILTKWEETFYKIVKERDITVEQLQLELEYKATKEKEEESLKMEINRLMQENRELKFKLSVAKRE